MGWYEEVTGTTEYQRQSWRDSYNGGRAAGDWTGSVNARLDAERAAFQGATWGGSSSQMSALEYAQSLSSAPQRGPATSGGSITTGGETSGGTGPGSARVVTSPRVSGGGAGSRLVMGDTLWWDKAGDLAVPPKSRVSVRDLPDLEAVLKGTNTAIRIGGMPFVPHPGTSDADEIEAMLGDGDNPTEIAWWFKQAAGLAHIDHNVKLWANDPATKQWAADFDAGAAAALPSASSGPFSMPSQWR